MACPSFEGDLAASITPSPLLNLRAVPGRVQLGGSCIRATRRFRTPRRPMDGSLERVGSVPVRVERPAQPTGAPWLVYDGVAAGLVGDTVVNLWSAPARVHRSVRVYDFVDEIARRAPGGILGLMIILPSADLPDSDTRALNAERLRRLRPYVRRLVTVPLGDTLRFMVLRALLRMMILSGGWSSNHHVVGGVPAGMQRLLEASGDASPKLGELEAHLRAQFRGLGVAPDDWLGGVAAPVPARSSSQSSFGGIDAGPAAAPTTFLQLNDKLRLRCPVGKGGAGVLWVADHLGLQSEVVVKFLHIGGGTGASERVAREAAVTARVRSPHVVQVLDSGVSTQGLPFLVMERLDGCDLGECLGAHGRLSLGECATIAHQLAAALTKTHEAGFVHCDVKPSNVFVCDGPHLFVKLIDFGLARPLDLGGDLLDQRSPRRGTLSYMSPEQLAGTSLDGRSDVWSLGVLVFECLTGTRPFDGESTAATQLAIQRLAPPLPRQVVASLPQAFDAWFATACARRPLDRFPSALAAAAALSGALGVDVPSAPFRISGVASGHPPPGGGETRTT